MRKTFRQIALLLAAARVGAPGLVPSLTLSAQSGNKALKFTGIVGIGATDYTVAADNGKVKTFGDADDFVKSAAKYIETPSGTYSVNIETGLILVAALPADLVKDAASKVVKYGATKTAQTAVKVALDAEIALMAGWEVGNALQVAKLAEVTAQRVAVVEDITALDDLIAKYTTIAAG